MARFHSIDASGISDRGRVRAANEDNFLIGQLDKSLCVVGTSLLLGDRRRLIGGPEGQFFCVADGLGGHAAGDQASATALQAIAQYLLHTMPCFYRACFVREPELRSELRAAVNLAQAEVRHDAASNKALRGMGTTLTMAFLQWPRLYLVHVGDSRCYLLRDELRQLTRDHTVLQQYLDEGLLEPGEVCDPSLGHALWNALGDSENPLVVDISTVEVQAGDVLLLCTDGLGRHVPDTRIRDILRSSRTAEESARVLVDEANAGGGSDNTTVVVVRMPAGVGPNETLEFRLAQDPPDGAHHLDQLRDAGASP